MYITIEDLKTYLGDKRLAQASDFENGDVLNMPKIEQAIMLACNRIDGVLGKLGYKLPLVCADNSTPALIKQIVIDLAVWDLYQGRATEEVGYRYEQVVGSRYFKGLLSQLRDGDIGIYCANGIEPIKNLTASIDGLSERYISTIKTSEYSACCDFSYNRCFND